MISTLIGRIAKWSLSDNADTRTTGNLDAHAAKSMMTVKLSTVNALLSPPLSIQPPSLTSPPPWRSDFVISPPLY